MTLETFIQQYGQYVKSYKKYDSGIVRVKFSKPEKVMYLKKRFCELTDMHVKTSSIGKVYWFKPNKQ